MPIMVRNVKMSWGRCRGRRGAGRRCREWFQGGSKDFLRWFLVTSEDFWMISSDFSSFLLVIKKTIQHHRKEQTSVENSRNHPKIDFWMVYNYGPLLALRKDENWRGIIPLNEPSSSGKTWEIPDQWRVWMGKTSINGGIHHDFRYFQAYCDSVRYSYKHLRLYLGLRLKSEH